MLTWSEFYNQFSLQLNEQQQSAVQSVTGPVLLLAVPGSGKTTVLVTRLGYMIFCRGIAPEKILTVTYTVAADKRYVGAFCESGLGRTWQTAWSFVPLMESAPG